MSTLANDLREGGRWTARQRLKNDAIYATIVVALAFAVRVPTRVLVGIGRGLGALVWALAPGLRRIALGNVARALPLDERARRRLVRRVYLELGARLGETVALLDARRAMRVLPFLPGARETLEEAIAEGRGVVFASAHLGPWERVAGSLVAHGVPITVVAREPYDPRLAGVYERLRARRGVRTVYRGAGGAAVALLRVLRRGGVLGIPMDLRSRVPSVDAPFLGAPAPTPVGPARLAIRTGAAVVVGTAAVEGGTLGIACTRVAPQADAGALTASINDAISDRIRALPEAWPWMHERWTDGAERG